MTQVLSTRRLNRALLERQLLLTRARMGVHDALSHLVGLQAQAPLPPYTGLWSRLEGFAPEALSTMLSERTAVRIALMRSTIHLVTAEDCLTLRPVVQPVIERGLQHSAHGPALVGVDVDEVAEVAAGLLADRPMTFAELGAVLGERWPDAPPRDLGAAARTALALVQVPPRALWGRSGKAAHTTVESWLGRPPAPDGDPAPVVRRYLAAFGPASVADVQTWSGLTGLAEVVDRLRRDLRTFRDPEGRELLDVPDAPLPDEDVPGPVRYVAEFDNILLSHADRTRVIPVEHRQHLKSPNGLVPGTVLVDGFVAGSWRVERDRTRATLTVRLFEPVAGADRESVAEEGHGLLAFLAEGADHDVRVLDPA